MPLWAAREKASTFVVRRRVCRKWAGDYAHPGTIVKCRLDPFRLPEETIPSWSRGGSPHPATAVMRTTLIAERKENIYGPPFLKTPRAPRFPPTPVGCFW